MPPANAAAATRTMAGGGETGGESDFYWRLGCGCHIIDPPSKEAG